MAFSVSAVQGYVKANEKVLLGKSILKGKTLGLIKYQPEVKGSAQLNLLNPGGTLQAGGCGWTALGTTTITKRNLVTGLLKVNEALCEKTLVGTFAEWELNIIAGKSTMPFEQEFTEGAVKNVQKQMETLAWKGNLTGSTSSYLDVVDGYIEILKVASGSTVNAKVSGTTLSANTVDAINLIVASIPNEIIEEDDLVIFAGQEIVRKYIAAYNASNQFAGVIASDGTLDIKVPNTNVRLIGTSGLNLTNKAYASTLKNFVSGGDIQGSESVFEFFYAQEAREYRLVIETNIGFQVAFPDMVVTYID